MTTYLDNAATTAVCSEAATAAFNIMNNCYGNPSSTHTLGRASKAILDDSRKSIASVFGCTPAEIFFTSCGTESDNWAILGALHVNRRVGKHIISSTVEHDAVRKTLDKLEADGYEITRLDPEADGSVAVSSVAAALRDNTALVTLMAINNETGGVTDIRAIAKAIKQAGSSALLHCDAVQAFLKLPLKTKTLDADLISISGHKIHAPKGIGALYVKKGINLPPFIIGGGQENGRRAGTESLPLIAAFATAVTTISPTLNKDLAHMASLKKLCVERLSADIENIYFVDSAAVHILSIALPRYKSEVIMNFLEAKEIYVSKSSACKKGGRSHVLEAIGMSSEQIDGAIRIGFSRYSTTADVHALCDGILEASQKLFKVL